jgi:branched-chain amino acid transport system ATP-binding protein
VSESPVVESRARDRPVVGSEIDALLRVEGLCGGYGQSQVLFDVNFDVPRRGAVSIVGLNGAGKTTLLRHLIGELPRTAGRVVLDGNDIPASMLPSVLTRRGVAYVPQESPVFSGLTVRDNLAVGLLATPRRRRPPIDLALDVFPKLAERLDQVAGTMSGGERKMLAIGRALLTNPRLLIMDEPTEGVWAGVVHEIGERLAELTTQIALLLVEQNIGLVLRVSDRVIVMERGTVALDAARADVTEDVLVPFLTP